MATYTKLKLSGSTDGKGIKVTQTATPGDIIHTAHVSALDEIWLYALMDMKVRRSESRTSLSAAVFHPSSPRLKFPCRPNVGQVIICFSSQ